MPTVISHRQCQIKQKENCLLLFKSVFHDALLTEISYQKQFTLTQLCRLNELYSVVLHQYITSNKDINGYKSDATVHG